MPEFLAAKSKVLFLFLTSALILLTSNSALAEWDPQKVLGAIECGECHEHALKIWKKSKHQKNYKKFHRNKDTKEIAKKLKVKRVKKNNSRCTKCHYTVGTKKGKVKVVSGVSCETCHTPSKSWFDIHNSYGGKGIKKEQETAEHKKQRLAKIDDLGLIRGKHLYDWAYNCYQCHIVDDEELVNVGGHGSGNDFDLLKYSQDEIYHIKDQKTGDARRQLIDQVGQAMAIQFSLRALASADLNLEYGKKLKLRYKNALKNLKKLNQNANNSDIAKIISLASGADISNQGSLNKLAKNISTLTIKMSGSKNIVKNPSITIAAAEMAVAPKTVSKPSPKPAPIVLKPPSDEPKPTKSMAEPANKGKDEMMQTKKVIVKPKPVTPKPIATKPIETKPMVPKPVKKSSPPLQAKKSFSDYLEMRIVIPAYHPLCITETPWLLGEVGMRRKDALKIGACFAVEIKSKEKGSVHIYATSKSKHLYQLFPNVCTQDTYNSSTIDPKAVITLPMSLDERVGVYRITEEFEPIRLYVVSSTSDQGSKNLMKAVGADTKNCDAMGIADLGLRSNFEAELKRNSGLGVLWKVSKIR